MKKLNTEETPLTISTTRGVPHGHREQFSKLMRYAEGNAAHQKEKLLSEGTFSVIRRKDGKGD